MTNRRVALIMTIAVALGILISFAIPFPPAPHRVQVCDIEDCSEGNQMMDITDLRVDPPFTPTATACDTMILSRPDAQAYVICSDYLRAGGSYTTP